MNARQARKLAEKAMREVTTTVEEMICGFPHQDGPVPVADTTVLFKNQDGTYSVCDNGESVDSLDRAGAISIIIENLTA